MDICESEGTSLSGFFVRPDGSPDLLDLDGPPLTGRSNMWDPMIRWVIFVRCYVWIKKSGHIDRAQVSSGTSYFGPRTIYKFKSFVLPFLNPLVFDDLRVSI